MPFPHEAVPDGAVFAPHHFWIGAVLVAFALIRVGERRKIGAWWTGLVLAGCVFAFGSVWPTFPVLGASMTIVASVWLGVAIVSLRESTFGWWLAVGGYLLLVDDVLQHSFGWPMPVDVVWNLILSPAVFRLMDVFASV